MLVRLTYLAGAIVLSTELAMGHQGGQVVMEILKLRSSEKSFGFKYY